MKEKIKQRCEIDDKYKWDLSKIYKSSEEVENDLNKKVDIIREHKNIKPIFLKMIQKDLIYV